MDNSQNSHSISFYIKKDKTGKLILYKIESFESVIATIEIAKDDYTSVRAQRFCSKKINKPISEMICINDYFEFDEAQNCADCPTNISIKKCLEMKRKGHRFTVKEYEY